MTFSRRQFVRGLTACAGGSSLKAGVRSEAPSVVRRPRPCGSGRIPLPASHRSGWIKGIDWRSLDELKKELKG
jgi:hypothetical protein